MSDMKETIFKREIRSRGMTYAQFAAYIGVSTGTICNWANGDSLPRPRFVKKMIDAGIPEKIALSPCPKNVTKA